MRPAVPGAAVVMAEARVSAAPALRLPGYALPLAGRVVVGFGTERLGQPRSRGITLLARPAAQAIAPAAGRVVFAGVYRGYGQIVIIEHGGGWTSLVTGLAALDTSVGRQLVSGSPLGVMGPGRPVLTLELRRQGEPVNPLDFVRSGP